MVTTLLRLNAMYTKLTFEVATAPCSINASIGESNAAFAVGGTVNLCIVDRRSRRESPQMSANWLHRRRFKSLGQENLTVPEWKPDG